jgi:hypothetical protein
VIERRTSCDRSHDVPLSHEQVVMVVDACYAAQLADRFSQPGVQVQWAWVLELVRKSPLPGLDLAGEHAPSPNAGRLGLGRQPLSLSGSISRLDFRRPGL